MKLKALKYFLKECVSSWSMLLDRYELAIADNDKISADICAELIHQLIYETDSTPLELIADCQELLAHIEEFELTDDCNLTIPFHKPIQILIPIKKSTKNCIANDETTNHE